MHIITEYAVREIMERRQHEAAEQRMRRAAIKRRQQTRRARHIGLRKGIALLRKSLAVFRPPGAKTDLKRY